MNGTLPRPLRSKILAELRVLREIITQARSALMHFKEDRVDRDKLEPAARRVDDLMNLFAGTEGDVVKGAQWLTEILAGLDRVDNEKVSERVQMARQTAQALREDMTSVPESGRP